MVPRGSSAFGRNEPARAVVSDESEGMGDDDFEGARGVTGGFRRLRVRGSEEMSSSFSAIRPMEVGQGPHPGIVVRGRTRRRPAGRSGCERSKESALPRWLNPARRVSQPPMRIVPLHRSLSERPAFRRRMGGFGRMVIIGRQAIHVGAFIALLACRAADPTAAQAVTDFTQWRALSHEALAEGRPVQLEGIVLCYDSEWGQLYIHDGKRVAYFTPHTFPVGVVPGQVVRISGVTVAAAQGDGLTNGQLTVIGRSELPPARRLPLGSIHESAVDWVEVEGEVRVADSSPGRLALVLHDKGRSGVVYVLGGPPSIDGQSFVGSRIRVRGIHGSTIRNGQLEVTWTPRLEEITVLEAAPFPAEPAYVSAIGSLLSRPLGAWTNHPVQINGLVVLHSPGERMGIEDPTGFIWADVIQVTTVEPGRRVQIRGFLGFSDGEAVLHDAYFEVAPTPQPTVWLAKEADETWVPPAEGTELTSMSVIRQMSRSEAEKQHPVRIRGVVTYADPEWGTSFIQDGDQAIYVDLRDKEVRAGQVVEISGQTSPGGFAPQLIHTSFKILGVTNHPVAVRATFEDLMSGHLDARWIELEGVVRHATAQWNHARLEMLTPSGRFLATIPNYAGTVPPPNLVDALVRVRGACTSSMNPRGQLSGFTLNTPSLDFVEILDAGPANPFDGAARPIASLATFDPSRIAGRRTKVAGTVTLVLPGRGFYLEDDSAGIRVTTEGIAPVQAGDRIEALGFPALGEFSPMLQDAMIRTVARGVVPPTEATTAEAILLNGLVDGRRVHLEARLVQDVARSANPQLLLQDGAFTFTARLLRSDTPDALAERLQGGSLLRLSGVCAIQAGPEREPRAFQLLLDSAEDIVVLERSPWWTLRRIFGISIGLGGVLVLSLAWIRLLRREVGSRTRQLSEESRLHKETASRLEAEAARREQVEREVAKKQRELLALSRHAGMAEVATGMLHNVGNVLNSVNVSANLILDQTASLSIGGVAKSASLLEQQAGRLGAFMDSDPRGQLLPKYLSRLGSQLEGERGALLEEIERLTKNVSHIREIVVMQQGLATHSGVDEKTRLSELVDDSLRIEGGSTERHGVQVTCECEENLPEITVERHKVIQILVNLLRNARQACKASDREKKEVWIRVRRADNAARISVADNGVGIPPELIGRLFSHGFTTRKDGHGFGLHSAALAARDMGGTLRVHSEGSGKGAEFVLEIPLTRPVRTAMPVAN